MAGQSEIDELETEIANLSEENNRLEDRQLKLIETNEEQQEEIRKMKEQLELARDLADRLERLLRDD